VRILALDWGDVRIGAAISDPDGKIAFPLEKIITAKGAVAEIKSIVSDLEVEKILIGLPKNLSGQEGESTKKVESFAASIQKEIGCPIELVDERFSSVEAGNKLDDAGMNQKKQRTIKDNIAAQTILQQYLDTKNN